MDDLAALTRKLNAIAEALEGPEMRKVMSKVGMQAKRDGLVAAAKDVGGDLAMHNWKKAKLNVSYEVTDDSSVVVKPTPSGPWKVISEGAAAHTVTAKRTLVKGKGSRAINKRIKSAAFGAASGSRPLNTPYGPRYSVHIPHTRGRGTWDSATDKIRTGAPKVVDGEVQGILRRVIGG